MTLRILVVGAGRAGMVHARNFASGIPGARLVAIADPDEAARQTAAAELEVKEADGDPLGAVTDDGIDAVVIGAPTFAHAELAAAALDAGKHVLTEKPLASSLEQADQISDAVAGTASVFMIGFMRRFDHDFRRVSERVEQGDIGEPLFVKSTTRGPGLPPQWAWDPTRSGGLVAEVNSHDLDTLRWLTGREIERVHAIGRAAKRPDLAEEHPGFVDLVTITCELEDGCLGHVDGACPATYGYDARVEVYGSEGALFAGGPSEGPLLVRDGEALRDPVRAWAELFQEAYRAEDAHFVRACQGDAPASPGITDGVAALEAALAANLSMAESRPVDIEDLR